MSVARSGQRRPAVRTPSAWQFHRVQVMEPRRMRDRRREGVKRSADELLGLDRRRGFLAVVFSAGGYRRIGEVGFARRRVNGRSPRPSRPRDGVRGVRRISATAGRGLYGNSSRYREQPTNGRGAKAAHGKQMFNGGSDQNAHQQLGATSGNQQSSPPISGGAFTFSMRGAGGRMRLSFKQDRSLGYVG